MPPLQLMHYCYDWWTMNYVSQTIVLCVWIPSSIAASCLRTNLIMEWPWGKMIAANYLLLCSIPTMSLFSYIVYILLAEALSIYQRLITHSSLCAILINGNGLEYISKVNNTLISSLCAFLINGALLCR